MLTRPVSPTSSSPPTRRAGSSGTARLRTAWPGSASSPSPANWRGPRRVAEDSSPPRGIPPSRPATKTYASCSACSTARTISPLWHANSDRSYNYPRLIWPRASRPTWRCSPTWVCWSRSLPGGVPSGPTPSMGACFSAQPSTTLGKRLFRNPQQAVRNQGFQHRQELPGRRLPGDHAAAFGLLEMLAPACLPVAPRRDLRQPGLEDALRLERPVAPQRKYFGDELAVPHTV